MSTQAAGREEPISGQRMRARAGGREEAILGEGMRAQADGLLDSLKLVQLTGHQRYGSVEVFHLSWPCSNGLDYVTLDESLAAGWIEITEFTDTGQVPRIKVVNRSQHMVFLMAGEQLVGCKQNRVLNASMMVPAQSEMPIPVTCVERGRWGYTSPSFSSTRSSSHYRLREMMAYQAARSYRRSGVPSADQAAVWREVSRKMATLGSRSSSDALQEVFKDRAKKLEESVEHLPAPPDCNGAVFVIGGRIAGADLFDKPDTLGKLWPKLIKSCTIDALETSTKTPASTTPEEILGWLERGAGARQESFSSPGVGQDVRIEGEDLIGASLVVDGHSIHMELFRRTEPSPALASANFTVEPQQPTGHQGPSPDSSYRSWLRRIFS